MEVTTIRQLRLTLLISSLLALLITMKPAGDYRRTHACINSLGECIQVHIRPLICT